MNVLDVLDLVEQTPGKIDKRNLLAQNDSPALRKLLIYAVSPYINFNLQKTDFDVSVGQGVALETFFELADKLASRQITGNAKTHAIHGLLVQSNEQQQKWFLRVLTKNLRAGVDTAVNDVWPGSIPEFNPALAEDYFKSVATPKKAEKNNRFPKLQSVKLDGMRAIAIHDKSWGLFSREGRPITGMPHIIDALDLYGNKDKVYDGELYSHQVILEKGFPFLTGLLKRQTWDLDEFKGKERDRISGLLPWRDKIEYHIFDWVTKSGWDNQAFEKTQFERLKELKIEITNMWVENCIYLQYVPHHVVKDIDEAVNHNTEYLLQGFEGSMLKDPNALYKFGRGAQWQKYKLFQDSEFVITGTYEGEGKWENSLGGFNMVTADGKSFDCGGGRISKDERDILWSTRNSLIGQKATVRYFELSPDGVPRFPIFHGIREPGT